MEEPQIQEDNEEHISWLSEEKIRFIKDVPSFIFKEEKDRLAQFLAVMYLDPLLVVIYLEETQIQEDTEEKIG